MTSLRYMVIMMSQQGQGVKFNTMIQGSRVAPHMKGNFKYITYSMIIIHYYSVFSYYDVIIRSKGQVVIRFMFLQEVGK